MTFFWRLLRFLGSVLACALVGSLWQTAHNLWQIAALGHPPNASAVLATMGHDLVHFAPTYAGLSGAGLLVAFVVATLLASWSGRGRIAWFALGGVLAIMTMLALMDWLLPITAIAAARDAIGIAGLCLGGLLAGLVFAGTAPTRRH